MLIVVPDLGILMLKEYSTDGCARLGDSCVEGVIVLIVVPDLGILVLKE